MPPRYKYGKLQADGAKRQQWMSDNSVPCPVERCTLNFNSFDRDEWDIEREIDVLPEELLNEPVMNALSIVSNQDADNAKFESTSLERIWRNERGQEQVTCKWVGRIGPGTIFIEDVIRASSFANPQISEITQAVYTRKYDINSLKRVFVADIANTETTNFIKKGLYSQPNGLSWPDPEERIWEYGTPEYQALLGTPIGKMAAALVLGAFPRGTRRIARITSWQVGLNFMPQLRFDIGSV